MLLSPYPPPGIPPQWVYDPFSPYDNAFRDPTPDLYHTWESSWENIDEDEREVIFNTSAMIPRVFTRVELEINIVVGATSENRLYRMGTTTINRGTNTLAFGSFARVPDCPSGCTLCAFPGACDNANCTCDPWASYIPGSRDGMWVNAPTISGATLEITGTIWYVEMASLGVVANGTLSVPNANNVVTLTMSEMSGDPVSPVVIGTAGLFGNINTLRATLNAASPMPGVHTFTRW